MKYLILLSFFFLSINSFSQDESLLVNSGEALKKGVKYHDEGKYDKAIFKYKQIAEGDTNYALAVFEMGLSYMVQKDYEKAIEVLKKGVELESDQKPAMIQNLGNAYSFNNQLAKAIETYRWGLSLYPTYFRYYYEMGAAYYNAKDPKTAMLYLDTCLKINFGYGRAHMLMGEICEENNYLVPAILSFQMASYLSFTDDVGHSSLAEIEKIAKGETNVKPKDSIVMLFPKDENNFEDLEEIIRSKSELDESYKVKPSVKLPFKTVIRCLHVVNSRLPQASDSKGWYAENLLPFYNQWWAEQSFPTMVYRMSLSTGNDAAVKMFKKNSDAIGKQYTAFFKKIKKRQTYASKIDRIKGEYRHLYVYPNSNLFAMIPKGESYALATGLDPKNGYYVFFFENGQMKKEGNYENGKESGVWRTYNPDGTLARITEFNGENDYQYTNYYSNGQPKESGHMLDGKLTGTLTTYYTNGVPKSIIPVNSEQKINGEVTVNFDNGIENFKLNYKNGKQKDGEQVVYNRSGGIDHKMTIKNEQRDGEYLEYYSNGSLIYKGKYKDGKKDGNWKKYYINGQLEEDFNYTDDKKNGSCKEYFDNGVLSSEANYNNDETTGKYKAYDTDGKLQAEYEMSKGKIKSAIYYDKNGGKIAEIDGRKTEFTLTKYNALGIKTEEGLVSKDFRKGTWTFYRDDGSMSFTQVFDSKGDKNGKVEEYYPGGSVSERYNMKDNEADGYYIQYYRNGNKKGEGYYVEGKKQGVWKDYYFDGTVEEITYYLDGERNIIRHFYPNGSIQYIDEYKDTWAYRYRYFDTAGVMIDLDTMNMPYGDFVLNYKNGSPMMLQTYHYGYREGRCSAWYANKQLKLERDWHLGKLSGTNRYFNASGKPSSDNWYYNGMRDSLQKVYYDNGALLATYFYKYDMLNGPEKHYYENGKVDNQGENKNGEREGWWEYYAPDGHLQYKFLYLHGVELGYAYADKSGNIVKLVDFKEATGDLKALFPNGNPSTTGMMKNGQRDGLYSRYYYSGKKELEINFSMGNYEGAYTEYYENGKIKRQLTYVEDMKHGVEKRFDEKGNLVKEINWYYDMKHGPEKTYVNGKLVKTINYVYDDTADK
jgi:antitoxin component YwqK of YwqJK toxin-antitoxin module